MHAHVAPLIRSADAALRSCRELTLYEPVFSPMESPESHQDRDLIPPSLQNLLNEGLDYAGVFPPAELSLRQALRNYSDYRDEPEAWMLSRFVLPVHQLTDLLPFRRLFSQGTPYRFSVLGTGGQDSEIFLDALARDLDVLDRFDEEFGGRAQVDVMEVPLPPALVGCSQKDAESFFDEVHRRLVQAGTAKLDFFFEVPMQDALVDRLPALCAALSEHNSRQAVPPRSIMGLKLRCGGADPSDVPSPEDVASLIVAARDASIPFKATAGLHHPFRHYDDGLDTEMHGFINLFAATALAAEHQLNPGEVAPILREEMSNNFQFEKEGFSWRDLSVSLEGIRHARDHLALSFGSCSFEEPVDHLRDLDLL